MQLQYLEDLGGKAISVFNPLLNKVAGSQVYSDGKVESDESFDARLAAFNITIDWNSYAPNTADEKPMSDMHYVIPHHSIIVVGITYQITTTLHKRLCRSHV